MPPPAEGLASRLVVGPALRTQPDRRLVSLVRGGYEVAFDEIVRRYGRALARYAAAIVGGRSEDVTQDAFSKALVALRRSDAEIDLRPWLFRIVRNTALNDLRDRPPSSEVLVEAIAGGRSPAEELERREEIADLIKRLQALPEPQRAAIVMRELEGLSHEEIAAALGLSGGAARQAIYRARQALRDGLGMLVPLPLLKALAAAGTGTAEAAAAGTGGVLGGGVALKATAATVLIAGAVGTGVALEKDQQPNRTPPTTGATPGNESRAGRDPLALSPVATRPPIEGRHGSGDDRGGGPGGGSGRASQTIGDDGPGHRGTSGSPRGGEGHSGPGGDDRRAGSEPTTRSGHKGSGSGETVGDDHSGPGDGSAVESESGSSSGPGGGGDGGHGDGGAGSGESESDGSGPDQSGDSRGSGGLTEQTAPDS